MPETCVSCIPQHLINNIFMHIVCCFNFRLAAQNAVPLIPLYRMASQKTVRVWLSPQGSVSHRRSPKAAAAVQIPGWSCLSSDCITSDSQGMLAHAACNLTLSHRQLHTCASMHVHTYVRTYIHTYIHLMHTFISKCLFFNIQQ